MSSVTFDGSGTLTPAIVAAGIGSATSVTITGYTSIGNNAFRDNHQITSVSIGNTVTTIGSFAFYNCIELTNINISSSVTSINNFTFQNCYKLTTINIPSSVTSIGSSAFQYCSNLTSVTIPDSVQTIGNNAFENCNSLTSVTFNGNIPTIGSNNFTTNSVDTAYYYQGATNTNSLTGIFTNVVLIQPQPAPVITSITTSSDSASINFTQGAEFGAQAITNYQYSIDNGTTWITRSPVSAESPLIISGLTNGTTYSFIIRNNNGLDSAASNSVTATINFPQPAPLITSITTSSGSASINFTQTTSVGSQSITNYQYSLNGGATWILSTNTASPLVISGLTNGNGYSFIIRNNNGLNSAASNSVTAIINFPQPKPLISSITTSSGSARINFTQTTSVGSALITNYKYSIDNGTTWVTRSPVSTATPLIISGLSNGTTYSVRIIAFNGLDSIPSDPVSVYVRPTILELKGINAPKASYLSFQYDLQNLVDSTSFTIKELVIIGFLLVELKTSYSNDALIKSRQFPGSELKVNQIISNGIVYTDVIINSNGVGTYINAAYSLTPENKEIKKLVILDQFGATSLDIAATNI